MNTWAGLKSTAFVNYTKNYVINFMNDLFSVNYRDKTYLVRNVECREEAYDQVHDFLGGAIVSLETSAQQVIFPPGSDVAEISK
jgi:hypothetical protein